MRNTVGKLMERIVVRKLTRDLEDREIQPRANQGFQTKKMHMGKCSCICTLRVQKAPEERTNSGCGNRPPGCIQQSPVQAADGPAHAILSQPNIDQVECRSAHGKNDIYAACSAPHRLTVGLPKGSPLSSAFFTVYTRCLADLNQTGPSKILTLADDGLIYKISKDCQEAAEAV